MKRFVSFHERDLQIAQWRLAARAQGSLAVAGRRTLAYVTRGLAVLGDGTILSAGSAFEIDAADSIDLEIAAEGLEGFRFVLPAFESVDWTNGATGATRTRLDGSATNRADTWPTPSPTRRKR